MDNFQIYEEIGKGSSSVVYKGRKRKTIEYAAVKCVEKHHHQKVFNEYCTGDLMTLLSQDQRLPEEAIHLFALDIVNGLQYVHSRGVVYCDLKPSNILIDGCGILKLSGFGLSKLMKEIDQSLSSPITTPSTTSSASEKPNDGKLKRGTLCYTAPELLMGGFHSVYSDFWSLGCILYEMASGKPPFVGSTPEQTMELILNSELKPIENCSEELNDLIKSLLQKNSLDRITWDELREHPFWKEKIVAPPEELRKHLHPSPVYLNSVKLIYSKTSKSENVMRLSKIVQSNLEKELGPSYDGRSSEKPSGKKVTDIEYNFDESDNESGDDLSKENAEMDEEEQGFSESSDARNHEKDSAEPIIRRPSSQNNVTNLKLSISDVQKLMFNQSDTYVKPIIMNSRIEKVSSPKYDKTKLPFEPHPLKKVLNMPQKDLENFLTQIYKALVANGDNTVKLNCLCYFETLCTDTQSSNLLVNSSLMKLFIKMLKAYKSPMLRVRLCSVTGLLVRHATYISGDLLNNEIFDVFVELVQKDNGVKVKRRALACMGELVFYVATQIPSNQKEITLVDLPHSIVTTVVDSLKFSDEVVQHYATKTIENIAAQSPQYSQKFATVECISSLLQIFFSSKNEFLRGSAISSLARMARNKASLSLQLVELITPKKLMSLLKDGNIRVQQSAINIINMALLSDSNSKLCKALVEDPAFEDALSLLVDHQSYTLRAKCLITYFIISKNNTNFIVKSFGPKLCACLDRLMTKEKEQYVRTCLLGLLDSVSELIPSLLQQIFQQLDKNMSASTIAAQNKNLEFVLLVMTTPSLSERLITENIIIQLSKLLNQIGSKAGLEESSNTVLLVIEALSRQPMTPSYHKVVVSSLLPSLVEMLNNTNGDVRFLCLKIFTDILVQFLNDKNVYNLQDTSHECTKQVNDFIVKNLLPKYKQILDDQDPIPLYGLKLLNNIAEHNPGFVSVINHFSLIPKLFEFFELEHRNNNVHNVRLILKVVNAEVLSYDQLYKLGIISKLSAVLKYAFENGVDTFFEPCLGIVDNLLYKAAKLLHHSNKGEDSKQADSMYTNNAALVENLQVFMKLCSHEDLGIAESACHVVLLLAQQYSSTHEQLFSSAGLGLIRKILLSHVDSLDDNEAENEEADNSVKRICNYMLNVLLIICQTNNKMISRLKREDMLLIAINKVSEISGNNESLNSLALSVKKIVSE
ncbi:hypothetical protein FDP41_000176 [Naegleria fowleri]|uniref:Protein kinase domain-containing protein n=1 Tax=Naegleria fowleri TaxID=5763 RepID=A0A6A5C765_NAEFO|nr:uncharacterized protein FDP41_000176 [Naegleria fowleri]KAF0985137.1 hypothetical protein FDP41_000176 [Naegleria fowleri]